MKRVTRFLCTLFLLFVALPAAGAQEPRSLDIYFLDMMGGASTLIVTPLGESVLIDTGSLRPEHRDADRILRACEDAKLKQIDYLITTHFHSDHFGALQEVSQRIPIKRFLDKGSYAPAEDGDSRWSKGLYERYEQATKGNVTTIRAGDDIPLKSDPIGRFPVVRLHCVAAQKKVEGFDGDVDAPVEGCTMAKPDGTDNARSIALLLTYGPFKFFAGGDITLNVEHHLAHPINRIGKVDLYQVTHHGLDLSNNTLLLKALDPTVAVAMNGPRKGIQPRTFQDLTALPNLKALYQIHHNTEHDGQYNTKPEFIANRKDNPDGGEFIKASVDMDKGIFTVQVSQDNARRVFQIPLLPPDLSHSTRIEIEWHQSLLDTLCLLQEPADLLNRSEAEYLESLRPVLIEDHKRIAILARDLMSGHYRGATKGGVIAIKPSASVFYLGDDGRRRSFLAYPGLVVADGHMFKYESGLLSLWGLVPREDTPEMRPYVLRTECANTLSSLHGFFFGLQLEKEEYPKPTQWCDAIVQDSLVDGNVAGKEEAEKQLQCPAAGEGRCHYAMNALCTLGSATETVLLFETKAGWNQHGGPDLFTLDNHAPKGGCVLLNDGTVKFIRTPEELKQLCWE